MKRKKKSKKPKGYWANIKNRQTFFIDLANEKGFDYSIPDNWAGISHSHVVEKKVRSPPLWCDCSSDSKMFIIIIKGGSSVLFHFKGSVALALAKTFPELPFPSNEKMIIVRVLIIFSVQSQRRRLRIL